MYIHTAQFGGLSHELCPSELLATALHWQQRAERCGSVPHLWKTPSFHFHHKYVDFVKT